MSPTKSDLYLIYNICWCFHVFGWIVEWVCFLESIILLVKWGEIIVFSGKMIGIPIFHHWNIIVWCRRPEKLLMNRFMIGSKVGGAGTYLPWALRLAGKSWGWETHASGAEADHVLFRQPKKDAAHIPIQNEAISCTSTPWAMTGRGGIFAVSWWGRRSPAHHGRLRGAPTWLGLSRDFGVTWHGGNRELKWGR